MTTTCSKLTIKAVWTKSVQRGLTIKQPFVMLNQITSENAQEITCAVIYSAHNFTK